MTPFAILFLVHYCGEQLAIDEVFQVVHEQAGGICQFEGSEINLVQILSFDVHTHIRLVCQFNVPSNADIDFLGKVGGLEELGFGQATKY